MKDTTTTTAVACAYAVDRRDTWQRGIVATLKAALTRGCTALIILRVQRKLTLYLQSMTDRELQDIGLPRSQIELTVGRALA